MYIISSDVLAAITSSSSASTYGAHQAVFASATERPSNSPSPPNLPHTAVPLAMPTYYSFSPPISPHHTTHEFDGGKARDGDSGRRPVLFSKPPSPTIANPANNANNDSMPPSLSPSPSAPSRHIARPDIGDYSNSGFIPIIRAVRNWIHTHPHTDPCMCELAQIAPYLQRLLPDLKGPGKCHAYATQATEAGFIQVRSDRKQHFVTLTDKGLSVATGKKSQRKEPSQASNGSTTAATSSSSLTTTATFAGKKMGRETQRTLHGNSPNPEAVSNSSGDDSA